MFEVYGGRKARDKPDDEEPCNDKLLGLNAVRKKEVWVLRNKH